MKNIKVKIVAAFLLVITLFPGCDSAPVKTVPIQKKLSLLFIDAGTFRKSISNPEKYKDAGNVVAGVVPHHLVASTMISGFFQSIRKNRYDTVIILAPNHYGGSGDILTSRLDWNAPDGDVKCDDGFSNQLEALNQFQVVFNDDRVQNDHSASNIIPYIGHYLKGAKVCPLLLSNRINSTMAEELTKGITKFASNKKVLLLCSIDFSHYLTPAESKKRDKETRTAILKGDCIRIDRMNSNYLDCPPALMCFLYYCRQKNAPVDILDNKNAADFLNQRILSTTSYFILRANN